MTAAPVRGLVRRRLEVRGVVQGVGFRPHVVRVADRVGVTGWCRNDAGVVVVEVEGTDPAVAAFVLDLAATAPPLARVRSVTEVGDVAPTGREHAMTIVASAGGDGERTSVPPDTAVCDACLAEMRDPRERRFRHPFVTCTDCGPRHTIVLDLPYDRGHTTMAGFAMCADCAREYADPLDRRFHAQPIGCHACGPTLRLVTSPGRDPVLGTEAVLRAAVRCLEEGGVLAVKGLGGFHLACDAGSSAAVALLRARKQRPEQPFAVMVADLAVAAQHVVVGRAAGTLSAPDRPIVLLPRRGPSTLAPEVAPGLDEVGVLLPYTPLHHLLLGDLAARGRVDALVMTSGNVSGEPLCHRDDDALRRLAGIADAVLLHDREIAVPVEDSVVAWSDDTGPVVLRRSRGRAPAPVDVGTGAIEEGPDVLAAGAELKNTVALAYGGRVHLSGHVGDLASVESRDAHQLTADRLLRFHRRRPDLVVADLHPAYASRAWGRRTADALGVPLLEVQHHHAHLASLAAEHGRLGEPLLGAVLDGTGFGCDRGVWGFELMLLTAGGARAERLGHLGAVHLLGGDEGVRNPVRTAALALLAAGEDLDGTAVADELTGPERALLERAAGSGAGLVTTSSAGRLVDVAASVLGVRHRCTYEAQAAIELEAAARSRTREPRAAEPLVLDLPVTRGPDGLLLDPHPLVRGLAAGVRAGHPVPALAHGFHLAVAEGVSRALVRLAREQGRTVVGLTGGVFVNRVLLAATRRRLEGAGLEVLLHHDVPANDGGLALGQAAVGLAAYATRPSPRTRP